MKKIFILLSVIAIAACSKDAGRDMESPVAFRIYASFDDTATKALYINGTGALKTEWTAGDAVSVYNLSQNTALGGELNAKTSGPSSLLTGELSGPVAPGDILRLSFLSPSYSSQAGTLEGIAGTCDYATADVMAAGIAEGQQVTGHANFTNHQAIVKFTCNQPVTRLVVSADHLVGGPVTVTPSSESTVLYVALSNTAGVEEVFSFEATRPDGTTVSRSKSCNLVDGKYYTTGLDFDIQVTSVSLDKTALELFMGANATLVATVNPADATDKSVNWSSNNEEVATVIDGVVSAVSPGEAVITATTTDGGKTATCNVSVLGDYNPVLHPFTIEAFSENVQTYVFFTIASGKQIEFSLDDGKNWNTVSSSNYVTLNPHQVMLLRGNAASCYNTTIRTTQDCYIYGNLMSLIDPTGYATNTTISFDQAFYGLFYNSTYASDAAHLKNHPSKDLALPATTLRQACYQNMFRGTGIDRSPVLPAPTLVTSCYNRMFQGCSSLTKVTCLATSGFSNCGNWLNGVAESGDFYKAASASVGTGGWSQDAYGIPSGWTVHDAE